MPQKDGRRAGGAGLSLPTSIDEAQEATRALRTNGRFEEAHKMLTALLDLRRQDTRLNQLAWQHDPKWWRPLEGPRARLVRRGPSDVELVRRCWSDQNFMSQFNRSAAPLPECDATLRSILAQEQSALLEEHRSLHWTIQSSTAEKVGFLSLVEIAFQHRRGEFLIGVVPGTNPWIAPEAAHLALGFAASAMKLERLTAYVYSENVAALAMATKLGFEREGLLRGYLSVPGSARRADLIVAGLLLNRPFFERSARIRRRLLKSV